ncbi:MAG: TIGR01906 family membrane protein [Lachnospiraceae bacterium]
MKGIQWCTSVIATVAIIIILLITSFELGIYGGYGWYEKEYQKYDVTSELEMKLPEVMHVTKEMMSYLRGNRKNLVVETKVNGNTREFFNDREKAHMKDVQHLFLGGLVLRRVAIGIFLLCILILVGSKGKICYLLTRAYQIGLGIFAILLGIVGYLFSQDFTTYFMKFHELFFTNDLWILDPETDLMIRMLPEEFFSDMVARIGIIFVVLLVAFLVGSIVIKKKRL